MTESLNRVLIGLARKAIETFLKQGQFLSIAYMSINLPPHGGVFVTIYKQGKLRGCIGTPEPIRDTLEEEIIYNAVSAATEDPRFHPVSLDEFKECTISIDVLSPLEKVDSIENLDAQKYGILVKKGNLRGLLLPDLSEIDSVEKQLYWAKRKAGIDTMEVDIWRFSVMRFREYGD